ncbi:MAG: YbhB/YbcL family Raf kinase inhibitor-like protein [Thermoanaerobaculia bacterium]
MEIRSSAFRDRGDIPPRYTCDGENTSPPIQITSIPREAHSLALIVDDPDAPSGTFVHWLVWNIPVTAATFAEGAGRSKLDNGATQGTNGTGSTGWTGPCPPAGRHRYRFTAYALDTEVDLAAGASREELETRMDGHIFERATLAGTYMREQSDARVREEERNRAR